MFNISLGGGKGEEDGSEKKAIMYILDQKK